MDNKESDDNEIRSFRESTVYSLMPLLKKGILHRTNIEGYKGIRKLGYIQPNTGQFPFSYPQSKTYYGCSNGYICLFDFESACEEDYRCNHETWGQFICDQEPITILFKLNRESLKEKLIPNFYAPKLGEAGYKGYIPFVEVWYPEPIPLSAVDSYIITCWNSTSFRIEFQEYLKKESQKLEETINSIEKIWLDVLQARGQKLKKSELTH